MIGLYRDELVHPDTDERGMLELSVLKNRHSGQRPPFVAKAVWHRGRYWEWDRNRYADADRVRIPRAVTAAFETPGMQSSHLPYTEDLP